MHGVHVTGHICVTDHKWIVTVHLYTSYTIVVRSLIKRFWKWEGHEIIATQIVGGRCLIL